MATSDDYHLDIYQDWLTINQSWIDDFDVDSALRQFESEDIPTLISEECSSLSKKYTGYSFPELVAIDQLNNGCKIDYIQSVVGDDEANTSNSLVFSLAILITGVIVCGIKLSWKDSGISHHVANFAEGWIISPPSSESSFEATNRRHAGNGVPWVLDVPKLKHISPVRKQSQFELDLESKYIHLAKTAGWTHRSWFTYDYHQMALILANCIFDFEEGRTFPFLFPEEGGCGGSPPYSNMETAGSHLVRFNRGKSLRAILGVMDESVRIHDRQLSPSEGLFVKSTHLAQMGDRLWERYTKAYTSFMRTGHYSRSEIRDILRQEIQSNLPADILDYGVEVLSTDPLIGAAVSHLRKEGLILTELDVKLLLENSKRQEAIGGDVPLREVIEQIDAEKAKFKASHWRVLNKLAEHAELDELSTVVHLNWRTEIGEKASPIWHILGRYYSLRTSTHNNFTSFQYSDTIRIFKRSDVERHIRRTPSLLKKDFAMAIDLPGIVRSFSNEIPQESARKKAALEWLESDSLTNLLRKPLPPGIGPDDARIYRALRKRFEETSFTSNKMLLVVLVSSDRELYYRVLALIREHLPRRIFMIQRIKAGIYARLCLEQIREAADRSSQSANRRVKIPGVTLFNYIEKKEMPIPYMMAHRMATGNMQGRPCEVWVEYDYPNIERYLENTKYHAASNTVLEYRGGFLDKRTLNALPKGSSWASLPIKQLASWADFDKSTEKKYPVRELRDADVFVHQPFAESNTILSWRSIIDPS